jgi:Protein kinase domain
MVDYVGQQLGNYRLIRLLGEGGFAQVYLGEHIYLNTQAAIKVLRTKLASDDVEWFRTEVRTIARLVHPNIVRVLDFDVQDETPFLVLDYALNGTLRQRHPRGKVLPLPTVVSYVKQMAEALLQCVPYRGRPIACALFLRVMIRRCTCGMPRRETTFPFSRMRLMRCASWPGRLAARALPLLASMQWRGFGM